jgi:hypothetical protein
MASCRKCSELSERCEYWRLSISGVPGLDETLQVAIWLNPQGDFRSDVRQLLRSCSPSVMADELMEVGPETLPLAPGLEPPSWLNLEK